MADMTQLPGAPGAPVVEPTTPQAPPPPVQPQAEQPPAQPPALPPDLIKIPAIQAILAGSPAALSMKLKGNEDRDEVKLISQNKDPLVAAGMGFYRSISGQFGVMFNALHIHPQDLQAADKAGKLLAVAPDFDAVNHEVSKMGANHPALLSAGVPSGPASSVSAGIPPQAASGQLPLVPPAPAAVARKLAAQRILNMQPGAPTSGPSPGGGRILNSIMKPVV